MIRGSALREHRPARVVPLSVRRAGLHRSATPDRRWYHISPEEQKKRLLDRLERPEKQWKYNPTDVDERMLGPKYQEAYQIAFDRTSTPIAPWYVVPADRKWYARLAVQHLLIEALQDLKLEWPKPDYDVEAEKARLIAS